MGVYHGNYEVIYKASPHPVITWDKEKEQTMIVEADDREDARYIVEHKLKSLGYNCCYIVSTKLIEYTLPSESVKNQEKYERTYTSSYSSSKNDKKPLNVKALIIGIICLSVAVICLWLIGHKTRNTKNIAGTSDLEASICIYDRKM